MKYLVVALAAVVLMGCGGGGSSTCSFSDPTTPTYDMNGQDWLMAGTTPTNNCPDPVTTFAAEGTITQSGNTITVSGTGFSLTGEVSGNQIKWGGTITAGDETMTIECTTVTVNGVDIGDTITFSNVSWTVEYDGGSCSGTATGTFTRTS